LSSSFIVKVSDDLILLFPKETKALARTKPDYPYEFYINKCLLEAIQYWRLGLGDRVWSNNLLSQWLLSQRSCQLIRCSDSKEGMAFWLHSKYCSALWLQQCWGNEIFIQICRKLWLGLQCWVWLSFWVSGLLWLSLVRTFWFWAHHSVWRPATLWFNIILHYLIPANSFVFADVIVHKLLLNENVALNKINFTSSRLFPAITKVFYSLIFYN